ncbi:hypothetical protein I7I51_09170 [Histoplasma capsulatum]|uniref:Uncharacterized protein n=2 Tax=Histoplasma TaxID=5036 RepID=A0A8A1M507_AJECA|nr:hypothetical protein I7I51_09170 [Histoplasma capsulatum]
MTDDSLTPIRVRGKRHKKPLFPDKKVARQGRTHAGNEYQAGHLPAKPAKRKLREKTSSRNDKRNKRGRSKSSHLEALPAELIEKIFLDSLELNLARASPHFGTILSRKRIYKILTFLAFFNDYRPGRDNIPPGYLSNILRPLKYVPLDFDTQKALQNDVIGCRWFNLSLLKECQRDMFSTILQTRIFGPSLLGQSMVLDSAARDVLNQSLDENPTHWSMTFRGTDKHNNQCVLNICPPTVSFTRNRLGTTHYLPMAVWTIPDKFFAKQPWTEEKFCLLHHLLMASPYGLLPDRLEAFYPSPSSFDISRERIQECIHIAIMEENIWMLCELLACDERAYQALNGGDIFRYEIRGEHFIAAVNRSENPGLLQILLRAHAESIPYDDPDITAWALRQANHGFGRWLLGYLIEVPSRRQCGVTLFTGGWNSRRRRGGRDYPNDPGCSIWWADFERYAGQNNLI